LTKSLVQPKNILMNSKGKKECMTNIKQVYNARRRIKKSSRDDMSKVQHLIAKLEDYKYVYLTIIQCEDSTIKDIFWAHPEYIKLFNDFSTVLIMDSTYKTNMYKMSLFEIVGFTSTNMTYYVAFSFLTVEKEDNFTWVLQMLLQLLNLKEDMSKVVVTDRDIALNVVTIVLPEITALLCYFHDSRNIIAKCIKDCRVKPKGCQSGWEEKIVNEVKQSYIVNDIMRASNEVVESPSKESY